MAYTKYSLTPANNNATPPDGAPEGMLPSAVNDTMRDMMAQIRDVGDGIRNGTYTMTAPVITGGSITGSTINNSAIGGTTANSGAFTTLSASGVATISAGTVSAPALTTTGDTNTGIFFPAADTIAFTEGGVESMRIDSSGNVGIGTSSPNQALTIQRGASADALITFRGNNNTSTGEGFVGQGSDNALYLWNRSNTHIPFGTNNTERMRIDSSGNLGLGVTPSAWGSTYKAQQIGQAGVLAGHSSVPAFTLASNAYENSGWKAITTNPAQRIDLSSDNNATIFYRAASVTAGSALSWSESMRIDSAGNVGIGTNSPAILGGNYKNLVLQGASTTNGGYYFTQTSDGAQVGQIGVDTGVIYIGSRSNHPTAFTTNNTERMRITSDGQVLINRTTDCGARLGVLSASGAMAIQTGDASDGSYYGQVQIVRASDQPDNAFHLSFIRAGSKIAGMGFLDNSNTFAIQNASNNTGNGVTLTDGATSWGTTSDERKKDIIAPVEDALAKLVNWRSVYYKYKTDKQNAPQRVGLIAQDVQATLPEAISVEEDEMQTLQLRYTETIPLLVKAIQEQQAMIEELKQEVALLKSK